MMRVMIVGSDGRSDALAYAISKSTLLSSGGLFCLPGNSGTGRWGQNIDADPKDIKEVVATAQEKSIDLVVISPEEQLKIGLADSLMKANIKVFGPTKSAAKIETSKVWSKRVLRRLGIRTPWSRVFRKPLSAKIYALKHGFPLVIKADGLARGKGVFICHNRDGAYSAIDNLLVDKILGDSGNTILIEDYIEGEEATYIALVNGTQAISFHTAKDYKKLFDGNTGPNTGGIGVISPHPRFKKDPELCEKVLHTIVSPVIRYLDSIGTPFVGALYVGLMFTKEEVLVLEFNARFGDPETQAMLAILNIDFLDTLYKVVGGNFDAIHIDQPKDSAVGVVLCSQGYPGSYSVGDRISFGSINPSDELVFHAGTKTTQQGLVTNGGRILTAIGRGTDYKRARLKAYYLADQIEFSGKYYRKDIGLED